MVGLSCSGSEYDLSVVLVGFFGRLGLDRAGTCAESRPAGLGSADGRADECGSITKREAASVTGPGRCSGAGADQYRTPTAHNLRYVKLRDRGSSR